MMRPRRRYIAFEIIGAEMSRNDVIKALDLAFRGTPNLQPNQSLLKLVFYDAGSQRGLLRCGHKQVDEVRAAITGGEIGEKKASFKVLGVSGTIKTAKRKFFALSHTKG
jgi:RNase P/RNase MRP subunit POP5